AGVAFTAPACAPGMERAESRGEAGAARPEHLPGGPNDVYRRVATPGGPASPRRSPRVAKQSPLEATKATFRPSLVTRSPLSSLPAIPAPDQPPRSSPSGPQRARSAPGCAPPRHRGDVEVYRAPPLAFTVRIRPGQRVQVIFSRTAPALGRRRRGAPAPPSPLRPPRRTRPPPRPTPAVAAGLNLGPVRRRARVGPSPRPFLCRRRPLEPRPRETPLPDRARRRRSEPVVRIPGVDQGRRLLLTGSRGRLRGRRFGGPGRGVRFRGRSGRRALRGRGARAG